MEVSRSDEQIPGQELFLTPVVVVVSARLLLMNQKRRVLGCITAQRRGETEFDSSQTDLSGHDAYFNLIKAIEEKHDLQVTSPDFVLSWPWVSLRPGATSQPASSVCSGPATTKLSSSSR